jgi:hypothetical protein
MFHVSILDRPAIYDQVLPGHCARPWRSEQQHRIGSACSTRRTAIDRAVF